MHNMMRALLLTGAMIIGMGTAFAAPEFNLRFGSFAPEGDVIDRAITMFVDEVETNSGGRIEISVFRNNSLGSNREVAEMAKVGSVDFFVAGTTHVSRLAPVLTAATFPYMFKDKETMFRLVDGEVGDRIRDIVAEQGLVILGWWQLGFRHVSNNWGPILEPEDMHGLKLRTLPSPVHVAFFRELGAIPTPMDWAEVMPALQQGVIDGQENPPAVMYPYRVFEFQKYYSLTGHANEPVLIVVSKATMDGLPPDLQEVIRQAAANATAFQRVIADEYNAEIMGELGKVIEINEVPEVTLAHFRATALSVYEEAYGELDDDGRAVVDAIVKAN
jgi:tripartite ATP-independent transporter DctP family solute receptor